ncbi:peptide ABC transporter substrate-binding protein [Cellvibrio mixtus]|uniref:peptide ABC transporter substrate-binding protein n=1 Tax=Cellvibrio mixtus TaxID=39650 RepID=UPI000A06C568|nr:peptide ABC transporter substrate-binding protein [Cellvibrio mixtus]
MHAIRWLMICVMAAGLLSGCGKSQKLVDIGNEQQILHIANGDEISDLDPQVTTGMPESRVQAALFEGLVARDPKTLKVVPGVAERWDISEDGTKYRFYIRENAKWSNGDDLTANDFVQSWRRSFLPALGNQYATSLYVVKNGQAFHEGKIGFEDVGVKAFDKKILDVELIAPTPYFLQLLAHHSAFALHIPTIEKFGAIDERGTKWTRPENFVGNGPFIPVEWIPTKYIAVKRNPYYWDAANVKLNEIRFYPIPKYTVEERMFRAGQLHITYYLPRDKLEYYKAKNDGVLRSFQNFATYFYRFNTTIKPLNDLRVRKALAYSVNRHQIVEYVTKFGQKPAYALTAPDPNSYVPEAKMPYDPDLARKLLAEAGFPEGKGFPTLTIAFNTNDEHRNVAMAIQQMWKKELGIEVSLENVEWKVFLDRERQMDYEIDRASWVGDYLDPFTFLEMFTTGNGNNKTGFASTEYDSLIRASALEADPEQRMFYFQKADKILVDEVPILPLYTYHWNRLVSKSVKNWYDNPMDYYSFKQIYLE